MCIWKGQIVCLFQIKPSNSRMFPPKNPLSKSHHILSPNRHEPGDLPPQGRLAPSLPVLVGEADSPGVLGLASVLLLRGVLPLGDDVTNLQIGSRKRICVKSSEMRHLLSSPSHHHANKSCTLMLPCRQCSSSRPVGSSVYKLKPDSPVFLMPVSWLRRHWNSSTVVEASKLTTCGRIQHDSDDDDHELSSFLL